MSIRMFEFSLSPLQSRCRMWKQVPRTDLMWTRPSMTSSESLGEQQLLCVCVCVCAACVCLVGVCWESVLGVLGGVLGVCAACVC